MGMHHEKGFTIIETLLFLAVSAILAALLLTGWTTMINAQRYNDSVKTFQTFIQQQFSLVYNVQNGRTAASSCRVGGDGRPQIISQADVAADASLAVPPGQSTCIIMGRYIHIHNGETIRVYPVVGVDSNAMNAASATNKQVILSRNPIHITDEQFLAQNELDIPWSAKVVHPRASVSAGQSMSKGIVIVRNPESGTVHTYSNDISASLPSVANLINGAAVSGDTNLCLDPGVPLGGGKMGVVIRGGASTASAVQLITSSEAIC